MRKILLIAVIFVIAVTSNLYSRDCQNTTKSIQRADNRNFWTWIGVIDKNYDSPTVEIRQLEGEREHHVLKCSGNGDFTCTWSTAGYEDPCGKVIPGLPIEHEVNAEKEILEHVMSGVREGSLSQLYAVNGTKEEIVVAVIWRLEKIGEDLYELTTNYDITSYPDGLAAYFNY